MSGVWTVPASLDGLAILPTDLLLCPFDDDRSEFDGLVVLALVDRLKAGISGLYRVER